MSYVEIFKVQPDGDVVSYAKARNNHACAPAIWQDLGTRHGFSRMPYILADIDGLERLWAAASREDGPLARWERVVLVCTFDFIWLDAELLVEAGEAFKRWYRERGFRWRLHPHAVDRLAQIAGQEAQEYLVPTATQVGDHLLAIAHDEPAGTGAAFNMCSANPAYWRVQTTCCDEHEDFDERPFNVLHETTHQYGYYAGKKIDHAHKYLGRVELGGPHG